MSKATDITKPSPSGYTLIADGSRVVQITPALVTGDDGRKYINRHRKYSATSTGGTITIPSYGTRFSYNINGLSTAELFESYGMGCTKDFRVYLDNASEIWQLYPGVDTTPLTYRPKVFNNAADVNFDYIGQFEVRKTAGAGFSRSVLTGVGQSLTNAVVHFQSIIEIAGSMYATNISGFTPSLTKVNPSTGAVDSSFKSTMTTNFSNNIFRGLCAKNGGGGFYSWNQTNLRLYEFDTSGNIVGWLGTFNSEPTKILTDSAGNIYFISPSTSYTKQGGSPQAISNNIAKISSTGVLDTTFSTNLGTGGGVIQDAILDPSDRLYVCGLFSAFNGQTRKGVCRLTTAGAVDGTFSGGNASASPQVYAMVRMPGGELYVGSTTGIWKIDTAGNYDSAWATLLGTTLAGNQNYDCRKLALDTTNAYLYAASLSSENWKGVNSSTWKKIQISSGNNDATWQTNMTYAGAGDVPDTNFINRVTDATPTVLFVSPTTTNLYACGGIYQVATKDTLNFRGGLLSFSSSGVEQTANDTFDVIKPSDIIQYTGACGTYINGLVGENFLHFGGGYNIWIFSGNVYSVVVADLSDNVLEGGTVSLKAGGNYVSLNSFSNLNLKVIYST